MKKVSSNLTFHPATGERNMTRKLLAFTAVSLLVAGTAMAEYPERPIDLIVAFSPGGGTDVAARTIEPFIEKYLGGDLTVLNKPGAGGEIGFTELAESKPDGYTIGFINIPAMFAYSYERKTRYSRASFTPIANLVSDPGIFAVRGDSKFQSLEDMIKFAKDNPKALPIGTTGSVGSSEHLAIKQLESLTGAQFNHVPFGSTAPMRTALLGGHIPAGAFNLGEAVQFMEEGQIRVLGVMSDARSDMAPEVPTFKEQGIDLVTGSSRGIAGPAGLPKEIVDKLSEAIRKAMEDPEYVAKAEAADVPLNYLPAAAYAEFLEKTDKNLAEAWEKDPWKQ
jgi:tripartite-type tricarboxylate transporter receptor subunit TctC